MIEDEIMRIKPHIVAAMPRCRSKSNNDADIHLCVFNWNVNLQGNLSTDSRTEMLKKRESFKIFCTLGRHLWVCPVTFFLFANSHDPTLAQFWYSLHLGGLLDIKDLCELQDQNRSRWQSKAPQFLVNLQLSASGGMFLLRRVRGTCQICKVA